VHAKGDTEDEFVQAEFVQIRKQIQFDRTLAAKRCVSSSRPPRRPLPLSPYLAVLHRARSAALALLRVSCGTWRLTPLRYPAATSTCSSLRLAVAPSSAA